MLPRRPRFGVARAGPRSLIAAGAIVAVVPLWHRVQRRRPAARASPAPCGVDGFSLFLTVVICGSVILAALLADGYLRREGLDGPELYVLLLLSASGGVIMASANDLIVLFLGLEILSIAVYVLAGHAPAPVTLAGGRHEVLRARRLLVGLLPLRHRPRLRRHRLDQPRQDRRLPRHHRPRRQRPAARRLRAAARRLRLQGGGRAVPLLDARRLPGLAQPGRRLHGLRREGRRLRRAAAGLRLDLRHLPARLAADRLRARRAHAARRRRCSPSCRPT